MQGLTGNHCTSCRLHAIDGAGLNGLIWFVRSPPFASLGTGLGFFYGMIRVWFSTLNGLVFL
jgi:hypothetical protein